MKMPTRRGRQRRQVALGRAQQLGGRLTESCESTATSDRRLAAGQLRPHGRRPARIDAQIDDALPAPLVAIPQLEAAAARRQALAADRTLTRERGDVGRGEPLGEPLVLCHSQKFGFVESG
jgi:hypothetical protein